MAKKMSYLDNLQKELGQTARRSSNALDKFLLGGRKTNIKIGSSKVKEQVGQFAGAVLQGRRYDDKTGKQIKAKKK
jgi:ribosomal protein L6P/L9E